MAIARLSMKVGKVGKAGPHAAYVAREGRYADRLEKGEILEAKEAGNMPAWAQKNPQHFWLAADTFERTNGTTYREMEIAIPREMTPGQRLDLVRDFVQAEIGDRHAYQWAIHTPRAADGGEQPHVHLMFSERQCDGIERDPQQYFKRYNSKHPERGGARKGYGPHAGQTLTQAERRADLIELRSRWEQTANRHLQQAGLDARIDMRSHADQDSGLSPEPKQLPSQWRDSEARGQVIDFREARQVLIERRAAVAEAIPSISQVLREAAEDKARAERAQEQKRVDQERAQAEQLKSRAEAERISRLSAREVRAEMRAVMPESLEVLIAKDPEVQRLSQDAEAWERKADDASETMRVANRDWHNWRAEHPLGAKLHDKDWVISSYLYKKSDIFHAAKAERDQYAQEAKLSRQDESVAREAARKRLQGELRDPLERFAALEARLPMAEQEAREASAQAFARRVLARDMAGFMEKVVAMAEALESGDDRSWKSGGYKYEKLQRPEYRQIRRLVDLMAHTAPEKRVEVAGQLGAQLVDGAPAPEIKALVQQGESFARGLKLERDRGMSR